jgi:hypothetical protein
METQRLIKSSPAKAFTLLAPCGRNCQPRQYPTASSAAVLTAAEPSVHLRPELLTYSLSALVGTWIGLMVYGLLNMAHFSKSLVARCCLQA